MRKLKQFATIKPIGDSFGLCFRQALLHSWFMWVEPAFCF